MEGSVDVETSIAPTSVNFRGIPLIGYSSSTAYFPVRVLRQFGRLQGLPIDEDQDTFMKEWGANSAMALRKVVRTWKSRKIAEVYFPEMPTPEELEFRATRDYILRFHTYNAIMKIVEGPFPGRITMEESLLAE